MAQQSKPDCCVECGSAPSVLDRFQGYWKQMKLCGRCWNSLTHISNQHHNYQDPRYLERTWQDILDSG